MSGMDVCCVLFRLCGEMGSDKTKTKNPTFGAVITNTDLNGCDKNEVFPPLASFHSPIFQKVYQSQLFKHISRCCRGSLVEESGHRPDQ